MSLRLETQKPKINANEIAELKKNGKQSLYNKYLDT